MSDLSGLLEKLSDEVPEVLIRTLHEATDVRQSVRPGSLEDTLPDIHEQLVVNRIQIERLEHLTATLVLMKSRTAKAVATRKGEYDDAYAQAATKPSVGFADYSSAKEKDAHYNVASMTQLIALRKAENLHRDVESAWDYCRILLRGAEGVQRDLETRLRLISLTSSLER